jgi:hypothetical protein
MPARIEVNRLLDPVGLWRLADQNLIAGKPISVKHEPDFRPHQRLGTTVPVRQRLKTTVPGACCADWPFVSRRYRWNK